MAIGDGRCTRPFRRARAEVLAMSTVCWLCGHPGADSVDHVVPLRVLKETGRMDLANDVRNLKPAHKSCNSRRQDRDPSVVGKPPSRRW